MCYHFFHANLPSSLSSINHAQLSIIFTTADHIPALLKIAPKVVCMTRIVSFDALSPDAHRAFVAWGETVGVRVEELSGCEYRSWLISYLLLMCHS
jgi:hypothetical protein